MSLVIEAEPVPLAADADGFSSVAGPRVTLATLVAAYQEGATPEEMVDQYPSIKLDHVYAVVVYYLRHREEVDAYLLDEQAWHQRSGLLARRLGHRTGSEIA